jgi:hypothetical protein
MASTRYVFLLSSLFIVYCMVDVGWDRLRGGGWTQLDRDDVSAKDEIAQRKAHSTSYLYRLYSKGRVLGHKRGKRNTRPNTSLIQIDGVSTKEDAQFYLGKVPTTATLPSLIPCADLMAFPQRVAYVYRAKREIAGSNVRVIWG